WLNYTNRNCGRQVSRFASCALKTNSMTQNTLVGKGLMDYKLIEQAAEKLSAVVQPTPLIRSETLSDRYDCNVYLKREDMQKVRSYKIRGAYNKMASLDRHQLEQGVICASAGNHAQGLALSCQLMEVPGTIYMPNTTPNQKVSKVELFGKNFVTIHLIGDTFDDSFRVAMEDATKNNKIFI